ncbi:DUF192 domain-containing protein [Brasilonema sp. UFV-L1]|uniref:DUF192 domain-containing protein n=1 Tax=Brasilonema sp. UFV-L1 TaxID=2234130 RepID=UPI00145E21C1|nr:DUF192 domain-containing protein [Brasilonema sp. UFV-L1]NMG06400.1 DUF192 domain-containing protein [Brasilonema sp. UFV-L1]
MIILPGLLSIILCVLLASCSAPTPAVLPTATPSSQSQAPMSSKQKPSTKNTGQQLPISAVAIIPDGTKIQLEVAQTPQQQAMGLMYRPTLPDNRGMLFQFPSPIQANFWMKNVPVPLDMVFMLDGKVLYIAASVPPCSSDPCSTYGPQTVSNQVIELRSGRAAELGLKVGSYIKINSLN